MREATRPLVTTLSRSFSAKVASSSHLRAIYAPPVANGQHFRSIVVGRDAKLKSILVRSRVGEENIVKTLESAPENSDDLLEMDSDRIAQIFSDFDEDARQKFLDYLHQPVVDNLGIRKSSHKIDIYNQCLPKRDFDDDPKRISAWEQAARNRSRTFAFFPLILKALEKADVFDKDKLLRQIDTRTSPEANEFFKEFLQIPNATAAFIRRIADAPDVKSAKILHDFLSEGLSKGNKFDSEEFNRRLFYIPFPKNSQEYEAMWRVLKALNRCKISDRAKAKIFLNIGNDWVKNANAIKDDFAELVQRYSATIADDLVLPAYIKEFRDKNKATIWGSGPQRFAKFDDWFTDYARAQCCIVIDNEVLGRFTPEKLIKYANRLEDMAGEINKAKPGLDRQLESFRESSDRSLPEWQRIFPDQEINGVKFRVLLNSAELQQEGNEMHHCVISLRKNCLFGDSHILSCESAAGERFSVHLKSGQKGTVRFVEATGVGNKIISWQAREAVDILCKKLSSGEIKVSNQVGNIKQDFTVIDALGFDIESEAEQVLQAYRKADVLPTALEKSMDNSRNFYQAIGLPDFLAANIEKDLERSRRGDIPPTILNGRAKAYEIKQEKVICLD